MAAAKTCPGGALSTFPPWRRRKPIAKPCGKHTRTISEGAGLYRKQRNRSTAFCEPCKRHQVGRPAAKQISQDFKSKEDIKAKFEWLSEYEPKDIHAIAKMFKSKKGNNKRKREEEEEIEFQSKALKCFYYWAKGWSKVLSGHTDWVRSVIKLNETTVVSGSADKTLRVWDLTNDTSRVLRGHTGSVYSVIKLNETTVVSASEDETLRVWDLTNDTPPRVLTGHTDWVESVIKLNETMVVSGSTDHTLRVWDLTNGTPGVERTHGMCLFSSKIERDQDCQWKFGSYVACVGFDEQYLTGVKRAHGLGHFGDKIERDHDCQCKFGWYVAGVGFDERYL